MIRILGVIVLTGCVLATLATMFILCLWAYNKTVVFDPETMERGLK